MSSAKRFWAGWDARDVMSIDDVVVLDSILKPFVAMAPSHGSYLASGRAGERGYCGLRLHVKGHVSLS